MQTTNLSITQDTGISVRKRVIKIFRDICLDQTDFHRIPDMCVKMIRRVNDEEGIKVGGCLSLLAVSSIEERYSINPPQSHWY